MQSRTPRTPSPRRLALLCAAGALALVAIACTIPSSSTESTGSAGSDLSETKASPARLTFGATAAQALAGKTSSFSLTTTPDLVLHAELSSTAYQGQTLVLRAVDAKGMLSWSYPHLQSGKSFDAVIPVFGSRAARRHSTGTYKFEVTAPNGTIVAEGSATLTSPHPTMATLQASDSTGEAR